MNNHFRFLTVLTLVFCLAVPVFAQEETEKKPTGGTRRQLATIIFAGLGGAVLGLSTLSFYGRPQDKLSNIAIGFAVGVIGGTVYVTYQTATKPRSMASLDPHFQGLDSQQRENLLSMQSSDIPQATFRFEF